MTEKRTHRAVSADGTKIAGRVVGDGPPLVLLHGALYCGETAWETMLPHLTGRFTCFLPSTRGRGLSADAREHSPQRWLEDVVGFVDSIGQPVPLFGWSAGGVMALGVAEHSAAVTAVVAYEPGALETIGEETFAGMRATLARMTDEVEQGRPSEAARLWAAFVYNDEELATMVAYKLNEVAAPNIPADLGMLPNLDPTRPSPTDPTALATISVPVLVLQGERTTLSWFDRSIRHLAEHVPDCEIRTVPGAGHAGPRHAPEPVAAELIRFLPKIRVPQRIESGG
jgi:pimeloyl-ACP methyl ester carboxylesterase